jgi:hypothetical protein
VKNDESRAAATECRVIVPPSPKVKPDPVAALNFAEERGLETMRTDEWMKILREGEQE